MYIGLREFHGIYFRGIADLRTASEAFFKKCLEGSNLLFDTG